MADPSIDWTENDALVTYTNNGLRPADEELPQPPQDPAVALDVQGNEVSG